MNWFSENIMSIFSLLFGTGGILYAVVSRVLDRKKYDAEVKRMSVDTEMQSDEFWKNRYDVLNRELESKDIWWRERYDNLYTELQNERKLSNEIINSFRAELNEIRADYEKQHDVQNRRYDELMQQYRDYREEVERKNGEQLQRISQLEKLVSEYEKKLNENDQT